MKILVLGAAGFIGARLARLLADSVAQQAPAGGAVREIVLADRQPVASPATDLPGSMVVRTVQGDICDPSWMASLLEHRFDSVFHLASTLTIDAETDFARGMEVNVHALMRLLEGLRAQGNAPRFLFTSSIATFGGVLPGTVDDGVPQRPQTSYGTHKVIAEALINDYSRRGFIDGRVLRLPVVLTHPGPATGSVSDRIAALIREPLAGREAVCPLAVDTHFPVASAGSVVAALLRLHDLPASALGADRAFNLPSLCVTPGDIAAALQESGRLPESGRIAWRPDPQMQRIVEGWPHAFTSARALSNGICGDLSVNELLADYLENTIERR